MNATTDYPIHELIANRWSPYCFDERSVTDEDLRSLFEAARWAPSSFNEQPWSYVVAKKENSEEFTRLLSCLVEVNQVWAKQLLRWHLASQASSLPVMASPIARPFMILVSQMAIWYWKLRRVAFPSIK